MSESVVIVALGASTPLGRDAWSSAAAVRAGLSGFTQHPFMVDGMGVPMHIMAPELLISPAVLCHGAPRGLTMNQ